MLVVVSDTHGTEDHRLTGRTRVAVAEADLVIHAGDFVTEAVYESFLGVNDSFRAVFGNSDDTPLHDRLPEVRTVEYAGLRFAVAHTRRGGRMELTLLGRERDADVVVFGHSHRPEFDDDGPVSLLNPGSHAEPRGHRAAHAELEPIRDDDRRDGGTHHGRGHDDADAAGVHGRLRTPAGETFETFTISSG